MATATATAQRTDPVTLRWTYLLAYLAAVVVAEVLIAIPDATDPIARPFEPVGLGLHILLVFGLIFLSVLLEPRDATLAPLLVAASLASLVRVFSLAVPRYGFFGSDPTDVQNTVPWLALVSVPLLVSVGVVAYVQRLGLRDLGLRFARWEHVPVQAAIALTGIPLGVVEFLILKPEPWIRPLAAGTLLLGGIVILLATGLSEELIFRAILLRHAIAGLGETGGLLYVTTIFASLHIFFLNGVDLAFVFGVGLFYGLVVLRTKNLWGAIFSHSLGNVVLYLVAPLV